ncbi:MAG: alkaline phosphatase D family protein, partial [Gemmatimonadetes bacterium]|nr:alkaline phosphatase D family protein [Gemmatimonadota bacterium]
MDRHRARGALRIRSGHRARTEHPASGATSHHCVTSNLRRAYMPVGPDLRLYRRLRFGDLLELNVLDTRQYRTDQPCGDRITAP